MCCPTQKLHLRNASKLVHLRTELLKLSEVQIVLLLIFILLSSVMILHHQSWWLLRFQLYSVDGRMIHIKV